jgi:hypothetical protein
VNKLKTLGLATLLIAGFCIASETELPSADVVLIDLTPKGTIYQIDSQTTASEDLLHGLDRALIAQRSHGVSKPRLFLLVHQDVTISTIQNTRLLAAKAGYDSPRVFYFGSDKKWMTELVFSSAAPFASDAKTLVGSEPKARDTLKN